MPNKTNLDSGLELIQSIARARYDKGTFLYIVKIVRDLSDDEWQKVVDHLIYAYITTSGDLPTPSQFAAARHEVNAAKPTKIEYQDPITPGKLTAYLASDKGKGLPVSEYDLKVKKEERG